MEMVTTENHELTGVDLQENAPGSCSTVKNRRLTEGKKKILLVTSAVTLLITGFLVGYAITSKGNREITGESYPDSQSPLISEENLLQGDDPGRANLRERSSNLLPNQNRHLLQNSYSKLNPPGNVSSSNSTKSKRSKKKKNGGATPEEQRRDLPSAAHTLHAIPLLYQLKLLTNQFKLNDIVNFTKCEDTSRGGNTFKGWKAVLKVEADVAKIHEKENEFVGFGRSKGAAKEMAAKYALMAAYPREVNYVFDHVDDIKPFCE